jgi:hypothetical protein
MKEILINECAMISGGMNCCSINIVTGPNGEKVPQWTIDGDLPQTIVEGVIMAGYIVNKFWSTKT